MTDHVVELLNPYTIAATAVVPTVSAPNDLDVPTSSVDLYVKIGGSGSFGIGTAGYDGTWPSVLYRNGVMMKPNFIRGFTFEDVDLSGEIDGAEEWSFAANVSLYKWDGVDWDLIDTQASATYTAPWVENPTWEFELTDFGVLHKVVCTPPGDFYVTTEADEYQFTPVDGVAYMRRFGFARPVTLDGSVRHGLGYGIPYVDVDIYYDVDGFATPVTTVTTNGSGYWSWEFINPDPYTDPIVFRVQLADSALLDYAVISPVIGYVSRTVAGAGEYELGMDLTVGTMVQISPYEPSDIDISPEQTFLGDTTPKPDVKRIFFVNKKRQRKRKGSYHFAHSTITPFDTESLGTATGSITLGQIKATLTGDADQLIVDSTNEYKMGRIRINGSAHLSRRVGVLQDPRLNIIRRVHPIKET
jgi:hypothetical protein